MSIDVQSAPNRSSSQGLSQKFLLVASFVFIFTVTLLIFNSGSNKVHAASPVTCGINTGNVIDYAGVVIYLRWTTAANPTTYQTAHGITANVTDATSPSGLDNILEWSVAGHPRTSSVTLPQTANTCSINGTNYDDPVVLAYTSGSDGEGGGYASPGDYVLDCDYLFTSAHTLSTFKFSVPNGEVPTGAPTNGTWDSKISSTPNGKTTLITLTYTVPPQPVTISGTITTKTLPNGSAPGLAGAYIGVDATDPVTGVATYTESTPATNSNGHYTVNVPAGDTFTLFVVGATVPSGYAGPYTDYQGPAAFTSISNAYNCSSSQYVNQIAGASQSLPKSAGCETVGANNLYDFIYAQSTAPPGKGICTNVTTSGTGPTYTATASYTLGSGVTYKTVSFNWGDGSASISGGTNSGGAVTSAPYTYKAAGTYNVSATVTFTSSSGTSTSTCPPTTVTYSQQVGPGGPTFTCNTGAYDITPVVNPGTTYLGAGFPASITFNSSGQFESDSNNPYNDNLAQSVNQSSQLVVEATGADSGLGITSPVTYSLSPGNSSVGPLSIQTPVGIYSVPYQVKIVQVVIDPDPATHWAPIANPNPTKETPAAPPASTYTNETTTVAAPVYTTISAPGNPTSGYYTQEDIKTTYTYSNTPTPVWNPAVTGPPCLKFNPFSGSCEIWTIITPGYFSYPPASVVATDTSDQYYWYITWVSTPNVECPPPVPVQVGFQPYMKVYGGDVVAGSTFDPGLTTACTPLSSQRSNIVGWNYDTPNYSGGGTEYASYALGGIDGFATSQRAPNAGTGLSFASVGVSNNSPSSGEFGGSFIPVSCAPDFFDAKPASASAPPSSNLGNIPSGSYYQNGSFTVNGGTISNGNHVTIYVNGNVYINGNITLGGTWNTIGDIPSFELVVQNGNIYIDNSVTRLDGVYVAQDLNQNATGTIYDCSVNQVQATGSQFSNDCYQPLVINGTFIATQVDLMRTTAPDNSTSSSNTLHSSTSDRTTSGGSDNAGESGNASEVFNYSPAVWLGLTNNNLLGTDHNNTSLNNYNSITSLPPVL